MATTIYDFSASTLEGEQLDFNSLRGKVVLVVNTASKCGFTNQYTELEQLYSKYKDQGLVVIGFPCNQFANQEPGSAEEIRQFCSLNYAVTFPLMNKIEVNGQNTHPLYQYLKQAAPGILGSTGIKWNFTKFLINRDGSKIARFAPKDRPLKLEIGIQSLLNE
jgi:glutathione peroxidase